VQQDKLPVSWSGADRFVRADYFLRHFPKPRKNDASTAYGFMYSGLSSLVMPVGMPPPEEDAGLIAKLIANLKDPNETYGSATYWQSISDLTNKHYRFKSLIAPSDVYFEFDDYNFAEGQPVRLIKRIDRYAQKGWSGDVIPHLIAIKGDIYGQAIE
jgi:choloylglycine hydrolase